MARFGQERIFEGHQLRSLMPGLRTLYSSFQRCSSLRALAPEVQRADLGDVGVEPDGHDLAVAAVLGAEGGLERGEFLHLLGRPALEDGPDGVVAAGGRAEEAELGGLADDEAELGAGHVGLGPFLRPHRARRRGP